MRDLAAQGIKIGKLISCQSNFWDSESGKMRMGEAALVMAVITKAIEDLPLILSKNEREKIQRDEAPFPLSSQKD